MEIHKSRLFTTLSSLTARERNQFARFLQSPYFNRREDVIRLWDCWKALPGDKDELEKADIWKEVYPDDPWNPTQFRLVMSYLSKLVEQFLAVEATLEDTYRMKMQVARRWRLKSETQLHQSALREAEKVLQKEAYHNADYFLREYDWQLEWYRQAYSRQPDKAVDAQPLADAFERAFVAKKLQQYCLLLAHEQVYQLNYLPGQLDAYFRRLSIDDLPDEPSIRIYWHCSRMLQEPEDEQHFDQFKSLLVAQGNRLPPDEARDLHLLAINYGIRQVNEGGRRYFHAIMDLYRAGLEQTYLLRNGQLSRFTYHNIVAVALQTGEVSWVKDFIEKWTPYLERRYRERMYNFSRAKIAYGEQQYSEALPFLQQSNYHDPLLNLGARALLLKIYYELDEYEVLQSHLDAFQNYLRRKPGLGYHRNNYRNLIRYTRKLLRLNHRDEKAGRQLYRSIANETMLTEKDWLLQQLEGLSPADKL